MLALEGAFLDWVEVTPDYFANFTGEKGETFTMKYTAAKGLSESLYLMVDFWHPVGGEVNNDFTFKIRLDWYPGSGSSKRGCRHGCPH